VRETAIFDNYIRARYQFFKWRYSSALANKAALALGMACVTGLLAQIKISLPWTPVPITGQTLAVLLAGVLLGKSWGGISQILYVAIGIAGVPWFTGWNGGFSALFGPTGGYLVGFVLAAFFLGYFTDRYIRVRGFLPMLGLMLFANFTIIHVPGLLQLWLWLYLIKGASPALWELLLMGTVPFVLGDIIKIIAAATLANTLTPKEAYNHEADAKRNEVQ